MSILSVNIIAPIITCFEIGFSFENYKKVLKMIPFIWIAVVMLISIIHVIADKLTLKVIKQEDSFNAHIIVNLLLNVFFMSVFMTVIGSFIGCRCISMEPINTFFYKWPRNFETAFFIELLIVTPIARFIMLKFHQKIDKKKKQK